MRKAFIFGAGIVVMLSIVLFLYSKKKKEIENRHQGYQSISTLNIFDLDSSRIEMTPSGVPTILIYYNSECPTCEIEIRSITSEIEKFSSCNFILTSHESLQAIKAFRDKHALEKYPAFTLSKINLDDSGNFFGDFRVPQIFVYNANQQLVKKFQGETKVGSLIQSIH